MSRRIFTSHQITQLLKNEYVINCNAKSVTYSKRFKMDAVIKYNEQALTPAEIFNQAGINLDWIGRKEPRNCLRRWKKIYKLRGIEGLSLARGKGSKGRIKTKNLSDVEKIKRLEAQVAYLKAENDFLARLRAKRAE